MPGELLAVDQGACHSGQEDGLPVQINPRDDCLLHQGQPPW